MRFQYAVRMVTILWWRNNIVKKIKSKISNLLCQHCIKINVETRADFEVIKRSKLLSLSLMGGILIVLFSTISCSDMPYTGSMLTPKDVDRYIVSTESSICLYNGVESSCLQLRPRGTGGAASNVPIIHVHPRKLVYMFYYEGKQIVHAEKVVDTTEIVQALQSQTPLNEQPVVNNSPPPSPVVNNPPPPPPSSPKNSPPPPPTPVVRRNPPPNNGGNNGGGNNGGNQQPVTRTATTLEVVSGDGQSAETNQYLTNPLIVRVLDQNSAALSGVTVSFSVSPNDGTLGSTSTTTGSDGQASTTLQLGSTAGTYTVTASVTGLTSVTFTATATDPLVATTLQKVSGDNQTGETDQVLTNSLIVEVLDQNGDELSGVTVSFSVSPTSGVLNPTSDTTDSNGEASTVLQLGDTAGTYTVTATVSGISSVTFTATATDPPPPPPPTLVATTLQKVSGDNQTAHTSQHLMEPLIVKVLDQNGDELSGVTVSFSVSPTSGVLSPTSATTDADGQASTALQLGSTATTYTVTASVTGLTSVTFMATATEPPRASRLEIVSGNNQSKEAYQYLPNPLVVKVLDQYNQPLPDVAVSFSVSPSVGILNPANDTTEDSSGEASTILRFGKTIGTYTVTATAAGINQSATFTATATERPTDSDWAQQSHYYDAQQSTQGWLAWIYYPENYEGPMNNPTVPADADFLTNGFMLIPATGATLTEFVQTQGPCYDEDKPCHSGTVGDWQNSRTYSVQIFIETTLDQTSFQVIWDRSDDNWSDNSPPPDMTYNLMSSKNMMTGEQSDPDHTHH